MKRLSLIIVSVILFTFFANSQGNVLNFKRLAVSEKTQLQIGEDFAFVALYLLGIDKASDFSVLEKKINAHLDCKKASFRDDGALHVAIRQEKLMQIDELFKSMNLEIRTFPTQRSPLIPQDFPQYEDTGNPKQDKANYHEAKQKWIHENPVRFEKIRHLNLDK